MATKNFSVTYYPTPNIGFLPGTQTTRRMTINMSKNMKNLQLLSKNAKIHDVKKLKTVPLPLETVQ